MVTYPIIMMKHTQLALTNHEESLFPKQFSSERHYKSAVNYCAILQNNIFNFRLFTGP